MSCGAAVGYANTVWQLTDSAYTMLSYCPKAWWILLNATMCSYLLRQVEALLNDFVERQIKKRNLKRNVKTLTVTNSTVTADGKNAESSSLSEQSDEEYDYLVCCDM
jgi:hypothetical protein